MNTLLRHSAMRVMGISHSLTSSSSSSSSLSSPPSSTFFAQCRTFSATPIHLKDKKMGREFRAKKQETKIVEGEEVDTEALWEEMREAKKGMLLAMAQCAHRFEEAAQRKIAFSVGGTAGIETLVVDKQPITKIASITNKGLDGTINVYHQKNVLAVKAALEAADGALRASMGDSPTILKITLPKITRDRREKLARELTETFSEHRHALQNLKKPVQQLLRENNPYLADDLVKRFNDEVNAHDSEYTEKMQEFQATARARILLEEEE